MRRTIAGAAVIAVLVTVLGFTSGFGPAAEPGAWPQPSEVGVETPRGVPFEFGSVSTAQSFQ